VFEKTYNPEVEQIIEHEQGIQYGVHEANLILRITPQIDGEGPYLSVTQPADCHQKTIPIDGQPLFAACISPDRVLVINCPLN
jgi:hypothetical protein